VDREAFANCLRAPVDLNGASLVTVRTVCKSHLATGKNTYRQGNELPIPPEDGFLVELMTREHPDNGLCGDSGSVWSDLLSADIDSLCDPTRDSVTEIRCLSGGLSFYLLNCAPDEIATAGAERRIRALYFRHGRALDDPVMRSLCQALLPALAKREQLNSLFVDQVGRALRAHIAHVCRAKNSTHPLLRGGLAPWQERRARDILSANLNGEVSIVQVARECGLSTSHFARAFRRSLGMAPHQWLMRFRVERAKEQLRNSDRALTHIAAECGFADQSHFTRVFTKQVGTSPGQWRRRFASGANPYAVGEREQQSPLTLMARAKAMQLGQFGSAAANQHRHR